jgi:hypothetical protein
VFDRRRVLIRNYQELDESGISRLWNAEVSTNLACEEIVDFPVSWNCADLVIQGIEIDAMLSAFSHKHAAVFQNVF